MACGTLFGGKLSIEAILIARFNLRVWATYKYEVALEKMASAGSGIFYHFLINLGNEF